MSQTKSQLIGNVSGGAVFSGIVTATSAQVGSINNGPLAGFRNRIINGNFDIWQRGTSFTGAEYTADRWNNFRVGTTHTVTRPLFAVGETSVPNQPEFYSRTVVASIAGAGNVSILLQKIEGVRTFAGQEVTVSFWARVDSTKNISPELVQNFGGGGSPSADVTAIGGARKVSIGTSWQKVSFTATVPSISGKTLGTDGNDCLVLNIWFDAGSDFNARTDSLGQQSGTFDIAQVQIEPGSVATPFEQRPIGTELALCQRYYETGRVSAFATATNTHHLGAPCFYKVTKRAVPTVALVSVASVQFPGTVGSIQAPTTIGFNEVRVADNTGANGQFQSDFTASAEL